MATETNNKNVTVSQLKKSLARSKAESDKAITAAVSGIGGGETATDAEVDAMLDAVFGTSTETPGNTETTPSGGEGGEA